MPTCLVLITTVRLHPYRPNFPVPLSSPTDPGADNFAPDGRVLSIPFLFEKASHVSWVWQTDLLDVRMSPVLCSFPFFSSNGQDQPHTAKLGPFFPASTLRRLILKKESTWSSFFVGLTARNRPPPFPPSRPSCEVYPPGFQPATCTPRLLQEPTPPVKLWFSSFVLPTSVVRRKQGLGHTCPFPLPCLIWRPFSLLAVFVPMFSWFSLQEIFHAHRKRLGFPSVSLFPMFFLFLHQEPVDVGTPFFVFNGHSSEAVSSLRHWVGRTHSPPLLGPFPTPTVRLSASR